MAKSKRNTFVSSYGKVARRQTGLTEYLLDRGTVSIKDLAEYFEVSTITMHRDLDQLEKQGKLRKLRGYATAEPSTIFEPTVDYWLQVSPEEKEAMARFAVTQVSSGQSVMLDGSPTNVPLARLLPDKAPLTVMTNFRMVIEELVNEEEITLVSFGGEYSRRYDNYLGVLCERAIASVGADVLFTSTSEVLGNVAFHPNQTSIRLKQAMMEVCTYKVILLDHTTFGKRASYQLAKLSDFDLVIVDSGLDQASLNELDKHSVRYKVV